jgi:hypothetical protein
MLAFVTKGGVRAVAERTHRRKRKKRIWQRQQESRKEYWDWLGNGVIARGWIASEFVKDLCLPGFDEDHVAHAVVAVGSKDKERSQKFIEDYYPHGAAAQSRKLYGKPPQACSYEEVLQHPVGLELHKDL